MDVSGACETMDSDLLPILDAIHLQFNTSDLKGRINKCSVETLRSWKDKNGFDLLHYCILENNMMAFVFLLSRGHFKPPYDPSTWPYLHLVSVLGYKNFISTIAQDLKFHNAPVLLDWTAYKTGIRPKMNELKIERIQLQEADKSKLLTPVDLSALFGHIGCTTLLLDFWQVQKAKENKRNSSSGKSQDYLSLACQVNSPHALRLLLSEYNTDKKEALECALRMMLPGCVDVILRDKGNYKGAFSGMNLYHVLFSYNSCLTLGQYEAMGDMVSVLISHQHDVNTCRPSRTHPLYSLLCHVPFATTLETCEPNLLATLLLLLKAGADPNLDEILIEEHVKDKEEKTAFGRRPFSSAVNCMIRTLPSLKSSPELDAADKYAYKCVELLLRHGADLSHRGKFDQHIPDYWDSTANPLKYQYGSSLHSLASTRLACPTNYNLLRLILHYGIDADTRGSCSLPGVKLQICYAVNMFPFFAWLQSGVEVQEPTNQQEFTDQDLRNMFYVMKFMSQKSLIIAHQEFLQTFDFLTQKVISDPARFVYNREHYIQIVEKYENLTREPWTLLQCCSQVIWKSCRQHMGNVYDLPIPGPLKNIVLKYN